MLTGSMLTPGDVDPPRPASIAYPLAFQGVVKNRHALSGSLDDTGPKLPRCSMAISVRCAALALFTAMLLGVHGVSHACNKREPTRETSPGPHDFSHAPAQDRLWREGDAGEPLLLQVRVLDTCGEPVVGALVRILHANQDGVHEEGRWRAHLSTDGRGEVKFLTVSPGYTGGIARHVHFVITHPEYRELVTRLFFKNDPDRDPGLEDLALVLEEVQRQADTQGENRGWMAGYEFVLPSR